MSAGKLSYGQYGNVTIADMEERVGPLLAVPQGGIAIELGVEWGHHANIILQVTKPKHLYLVDMWADPGKYEVVLGRYKDRDDVTIRRKKTMQIVDEFENEFFDWMFIDANHMYYGVHDDIMAYYPKLKCGGFMLLHDYDYDERWDRHGGVRKAVHDALDALPDLHWVAKGVDAHDTVVLRKINLDIAWELE